MAGFIEDSRILISASAFCLGHMLFWLKNMKKIWPRTDMYSEKEYFNSFFQIIVNIPL